MKTKITTTEPELQPYVGELVRIFEAGQLEPGEVSLVEVAHDDDCPIWSGEMCDCKPAIQIQQVDREATAQEFVQGLRDQGATFKLHRDHEGFGVHTPDDLPITEEMNARIQFFGPEILSLLREEKRERRSLSKKVA
jgi:hypothetical protein